MDLGAWASESYRIPLRAENSEEPPVGEGGEGPAAG
jgi:endogenous inhibitor of DNA gyrase (YacG/DUF329 family)